MPGRERDVSRVTRSKAEALATYDRVSPWYTVLEGVWERGFRRAGVEALDARQGERVLEIGFGPGDELPGVAHAVGPSGRLCGLDLSRKMIDVARSRLERSGLRRDVGLVRGDGARLPFRTAVFDAIFMSFTLELFDTPEIPVVLGESKRVLREGGRICVVSMTKSGEASWLRTVYEWGHRTFPRFLDCRPIYVRASLEEAGFRIRSSRERSPGGLPVELVLAFKAG